MNLTHELQDMAENVGELVASHLRLAQVEARDDLRWIGKRLGVALALAPLVLVGHAMLCAALALELARVMPLPMAVAGVGFLNLIAGTIGIGIATQQIHRREVLVQTFGELEASSASMVRAAGVVP
jgi:hypothetical protein